MAPIRTLNLMTDEELATVVSDCEKSLVELRPYNGTSPGAKAIAETRDRMEKAQAEITRRPTRLYWVCTDQRDGRRVHVDARGNLINGASRLVHSGGRIACDDGRVAEPHTVHGGAR